MQGGQLGSLATEREGERLGHRFAGQVVFRGAQSAHDDHDVCTSESVPDNSYDVFAPVSDDSLEGHGNTDLIQSLGQIKGIGVLAKRGEHFGADSNNFRFHRGSF